jgi:hypothetical protein
MSHDLFKSFSQHFMRPSSHSPTKCNEYLIKHFVCDFIEDEKGLIYFLQVKAIEYTHREQMKWSPSTSYTVKKVRVEKEEVEVCEGKVVCG